MLSGAHIYFSLEEWQQLCNANGLLARLLAAYPQEFAEVPAHLVEVEEDQPAEMAVDAAKVKKIAQTALLDGFVCLSPIEHRQLRALAYCRI